MTVAAILTILLLVVNRSLGFASSASCTSCRGVGLPLDAVESGQNEGLLQLLPMGRRTAMTTGFASLGVPSSLAPPAFAKDLGEDYRQGTAALADMDSNAPVPREAYKKLGSGVIIADLLKGSVGGVTVEAGSKVTLEWVLRKSNGYFVDSSQVVGAPFIITVGDGKAIKGVDEGIRGMKQGGVRRLLIPPSLAYVDGLDDGKPGPLPVGFGPRQQMRRVQDVRKDVPGEYVYLEVQVIRVR